MTSKRLKKLIPGNGDFYPVGTLVECKPSRYLPNCFSIHAPGKPVIVGVPKDYLEEIE